jgi:hypothetical protein
MRQAARPGAQPTASAASPTRLPGTVLTLAAVQVIETAGLLAATVLVAVDTISGKSYQAASGIALTLIGVGTVVALGFVAAGLRRGRRWSRTPALLTQLFTGIVGIYLIQGQRLEWGVPAILLGVAGLVLVFVPASVRTLARQPAAQSGRRG